MLNAIICWLQLNTQGVLGWLPVSGFLVIDVVGWQSMYFVVMPRVNLIVILMIYVRYLYSINCPTVICIPSMLLFILWRDTTSELWTPVQLPLHCYYRLLFTLSVYILAYYYLLPLDTLNPLFITNQWDWQPHCKLGTMFLVVFCAGSMLLLVKKLPRQLCTSIFLTPLSGVSRS
jgi:hypothetical protein